MPSESRVALVFFRPVAPKSLAWLFAMLTILNPASTSAWAHAGGVRNAWQLVLPALHLRTPVSSVTASSRLANCRSALSASRTSLKKPLALLGGMFGAAATTVSPTAEKVNDSDPLAAFEFGAPAGVGTGGDCCPTVAVGVLRWLT